MSFTLAFDVESTGLATSTARIVSLCMIRKDTNEKFYTTVNPEIPIPSDSTEVHGLTDADVADSPSFRDILPTIEKWLDSANVLQAFNGYRFDVYILQAELTRAGSNHSVLKMPLLDDLRVWQEGEPRSLEDASKRWLGCGIEEAHNASADVDAMLAIDREMRKEFGFENMTDLELAAMLKGDNVTPDGKFLWEDGRVMMHWSKKHFGKPVIEVASSDPDFFNFILSKDGDWLNHGVRALVVKALEDPADEDGFNHWVINKFGPPPAEDEDKKKISASSPPCPVCGGPMFHEPIFSGDPDYPDEVIDAVPVCEMNNCDIYGFLYYQEELF